MDTITASAMKALELQADQAGLSFRDMMYNAGAAACKAIQRDFAGKNPLTIVFAGPGNNGGDGYIAAGLLAAMGCPVITVQVDGGPRGELSASQMASLQRLHVPVCPVDDLSAIQKRFIQQADVVVDAMYGTGFRGEMSESARQAAAMMAASQGQVWALDLPSGVECDTGRAAEGAVKADVTIAFHSAKPAHVTEPAASLCGRVEVADIGIGQALQPQEAN